MAIQERFGDASNKDASNNGSNNKDVTKQQQQDNNVNKSRSSKSPRNSHSKPAECDHCSSHASTTNSAAGLFTNNRPDSQNSSVRRSDVGFHPSKLTFRFIESGYRPRNNRRLSMGSVTSSDNPIMHSTVLELMDFVDLFKAFALRCRKDLKDLFEQVAVQEPAKTLTPPAADDMMQATNQNSGKAMNVLSQNSVKVVNAPVKNSDRGMMHSIKTSVKRDHHDSVR